MCLDFSLQVHDDYEIREGEIFVLLVLGAKQSFPNLEARTSVDWASSFAKSLRGRKEDTKVNSWVKKKIDLPGTILAKYELKWANL